MESTSFHGRLMVFHQLISEMVTNSTPSISKLDGRNDRIISIIINYQPCILIWKQEIEWSCIGFQSSVLSYVQIKEGKGPNTNPNQQYCLQVPDFLVGLVLQSLRVKHVN
jgi:hypothetical protein